LTIAAPLREEGEHMHGDAAQGTSRVDAKQRDTALDVSMPMRLYWVLDGFGLGFSQTPIPARDAVRPSAPA
jgi:hypothetical protein